MSKEVTKYHQLAIDQTIPEFHEALKHSLLLKENLPDLLSCAPLALGLLGTCRLLACSDAACSIRLEQPVGGWKYLRYEGFNPVLMNGAVTENA